MGALRVLGNILWHVPFLGFLQAIMTFFAGCLFMITVIGAPIGLGLIEYSKFLMWPFGKAMVSKNDLNIKQNEAWKKFSIVIMILYFPIGILLCALAILQVGLMGITLIGIPSALVIAKSLGTFLNPVFKKCVHVSVAEELEKRKANQAVETYLGSNEAESTSENSFKQTVSSESTNATPSAEISPAVSTIASAGETIASPQQNFESASDLSLMESDAQVEQTNSQSANVKPTSGSNKLVMSIVMVVVIIAVGISFMKYQANSKFKVNQAEAATFLGRWCELQSSKNLSEYAGLYAQDFEGIKRTKSGRVYNFNCAQWLNDRAKIYRRARYLSVSADNISVKDFDGNTNLTSVQFTQRYSSDRYNDKGTKLVKLRKSGDGSIIIAYEEMLSSY